MSNPLDIKQLSKVIDLCRKKGVYEITVDGVTMKLGAEPVRSKRNSKSAPDAEIADTEAKYTDEDLLFWSANQIGGQ